MFLKEIELTNFKCHKHLYLNFEGIHKPNSIRKTTFILGENGTGKSALLKAIALITSGSTALADILDNPDEWVRNKESFCEIKSTLVTQDGEERKLRFRITRGHHLRDIIHENSESLALIDNAIANASRNYFVVAYGASRRLGLDQNTFNTQRRRSPRSKNIQSLFNPDAALIQLTNWAMEMDYKAGRINTVRDALNQFLIEGVSFKHIDKKQAKLIFNTPDGDVPLDQLSDGFQNVAAWVGDLMFNITNTFNDHKDPLKARGLLLIDEIDLHLHPKWQRRLYAFIQNKLPNFQIIATTHSPLTAQQAAEGELYALKREAANVALIPFVGDPSRMLIHQILMAPIFGLETDESLKIEDAKKKIREVRLKEKPTKQEENSIKIYEELLNGVPINIRSNSLLADEDMNLLQEINTQLAAKIKSSKTTKKKVAKKRVAKKTTAVKAKKVVKKKK